MSTMTSAWQTGTYDLLVYQDPEAEKGALMVVVFAAPTDLDNKDADDDAPILAHIDVPRADYDDELAEFMLDIHSCGERGLIWTQQIEAVFGTILGERVMTAMYQAVDNDIAGVDMDGRPWRSPSADSLPLLQKIYELLTDMRGRIEGASP